ncbi:uncharacterized protein EAE97_003720 [Botrytis byssoidea]|uniref:Uncharacterized protein n=1 Tax=Botrytis byssoidea TaxID=139641 RepID=A0A9P5ITR3_9HELO|nr:uncharacterized protein EAE97_003720 [Botrytis byssoidea]KAF7948309.1 hypothetical protein EAE97_003720 [Botrytis byssoidea]
MALFSAFLTGPGNLARGAVEFGPLPDELVKHVDDEKAGEHLKDLWKMIEEDEERTEGYEPFEQ